MIAAGELCFDSASESDSCVAMANDVDSEYTNLLAEFERERDLVWITRSKTFPQIPGRPHRSAQQIQTDTLASERVQEVIEEEIVRRKWPRTAVEAEAKEMIATMGHNFQLTTVRAIGYGFTKVVKRVFSGIHVNTDRIEEVRERCRQDPVVFMPTHSSYMDFLLLSYVCFAYELPLPAIAAGMDFMNSKVMGEALRRCGAFFIRRSFGQDRLYWAIFTEYVQSHLIMADRPVEFFPEGTRSRTGKSLFPKYGLLQVLLEPYLRSQVFDLTIVPVSMNYDKILEETLYGYELLGFPKPKESTSGLLKARNVLNMDFGAVFVTFGEPISVRDYFGSILERSEHALQPDARFSLSATEREAIRVFGHRIIKIHNKNGVTKIWSLAAAVCADLLVEQPIPADQISHSQLLKRLQQLFNLTERLGFKLSLCKGSVLQDLNYFLQMHANIVTYDAGTGILTVPAMPSGLTDGRVPAEIVGTAVPRIVLANYANKMLHLFADVGYVALALRNRSSSRPVDDVFEDFRFLQTILNRDFVCVPSEEHSSFEEAVDRLEKAGAISRQSGGIDVHSSADLLALTNLLTPFLVAYIIIYRSILSQPGRHWTESDLVAFAQQHIAALLLSNTINQHTVASASSSSSSSSMVGVRHSMLSTDLLKNAFQSLVACGGLTKTETNNGHYAVDVVRTSHFAERLGAFAPFDWRSVFQAQAKL
uniref:Phospholipid/glycerol acyltransferase domain-containing protein n=1 Tax=Plectus sambesii TaxID=2011161 RepID=A0A914UZ98_9BILA